MDISFQEFCLGHTLLHVSHEEFLLLSFECFDTIDWFQNNFIHWFDECCVEVSFVIDLNYMKRLDLTENLRTVHRMSTGA